MKKISKKDLELVRNVDFLRDKAIMKPYFKAVRAYLRLIKILKENNLLEE